MPLHTQTAQFETKLHKPIQAQTGSQAEVRGIRRHGHTRTHTNKCDTESTRTT